MPDLPIQQTVAPTRSNISSQSAKDEKSRGILILAITLVGAFLLVGAAIAVMLMVKRNGQIENSPSVASTTTSDTRQTDAKPTNAQSGSEQPDPKADALPPPPDETPGPSDPPATAPSAPPIGGEAPPPAAESKPPETTEMPKLVKFRMSDLDMTLQVPEEWKFSQSVNSVEYRDALGRLYNAEVTSGYYIFYPKNEDESGGEYVRVTLVKEKNKSLDELYKDRKETLAKKAKDYKFVSEDTATIDGMPARLLIYDITGKDNNQYRLISAFVVKNKAAYYMTCCWPADKFADMKGCFLEIITSAKLNN